MSIHFKSIAFGFILACVIGLGGVIAVLFFGTSDSITTYHPARLPSGKEVNVISFHLAWGIDHDVRHSNDDCFIMEYVSSDPAAGQESKDRETEEVFELIRPISEQWGFQRAEISMFPVLIRKGKYDIYSFTRRPDGTWTFDRKEAKVHIND